MKIAIVGCGAIGGYVGAKLAHSGETVTFMVRGATLEAVRARGVTLQMSDGGTLVARNVTATSDYARAGAAVTDASGVVQPLRAAKAATLSGDGFQPLGVANVT